MSLLTILRNANEPPPDPPPIDPDPAEDKLRNKTGIRTIFDKAMTKGQKLTLEQAIAILRRDW